MQRIMRFEDFARKEILESIKSDATEIESEIDVEDLETVDPKKLAVTLSKLIDAGGNLDKIDMQQIEESYLQILEEESGEEINEAEGAVVVALEVVGTILGNTALMHFLAEGISKILGRKVEASKITSSVKSFLDKVSKVTGYPAKMIEKFFAWLGKIFGFNPSSRKILSLIGLSIVTIVLLAVGIAYFPAAAAITGTAGVLTLILSVTALIGKAAEITKIVSEIIKVVKLELNNGDKELTEEEIEIAIHGLENAKLSIA
jgi:hypothetical protein